MPERPHLKAKPLKPQSSLQSLLQSVGTSGGPGRPWELAQLDVHKVGLPGCAFRIWAGFWLS